MVPWYSMYRKPTFSFKQMNKENFKSVGTWDFSLQSSKRIFIRKTEEGSTILWGEQTYRSDFGTYKSVFKKIKNCQSMEKMESTEKAKVKKEKFTDVDKLLKKHFGQEWRSQESLQYYQNVIDNIDEDVAPGDENEEQIFCQMQDYEETTVLDLDLFFSNFRIKISFTSRYFNLGWLKMFVIDCY